MLCSAVFVSLVHQKKYLCVQGFAKSYARKGKGISLFDIFFPHAPLAEKCSWKIRGNSDLLFVFFSRRASQYGNFIFEAFWPSVQGTMS